MHGANNEDPFDEKGEDLPDAPPSMSGAFGAGTENGTWLAGGLHRGVWHDDTIRYIGARATGRINVDIDSRDTGFPFAHDMLFLYQDIRFRAGDTDLFLGVNDRFADLDGSFRDAPPPYGSGSATNEAGLGGTVLWDSRDNAFTPTQGQEAEFSAVAWSEAFGGDTEFVAGQAFV